MKLRDRINQDLTSAMKARDADSLRVLRMMKTAVKNKEIEVRGELDDPQVVEVLSALVKQRRDSIEQFSRGGRPELAAQEAAEIKVIEGYLPAALGEEEIIAAVEEAIRATGASSPKDMGKVMKECMLRFSGKPVDGKQVSALVKQRLESSS
ncbi:MAG: glutamyl-tRNA amidotransferase [Acidobacteria bacterium]|nr:MAG: glutamyl-tRNA amidotransferase [Acidobacteriota bacterium]PYV42851.1 MAG: glutamyl-tRNA amidotransferase [Acidobacteriota bacterium]